MLEAAEGSRGMNEYFCGEPSLRIWAHFHGGVDGHSGSDASHCTGTLNPDTSQKSERMKLMKHNVVVF